MFKLFCYCKTCFQRKVPNPSEKWQLNTHTQVKPNAETYIEYSEYSMRCEPL